MNNKKGNKCKGNMNKIKDRQKFSNKEELKKIGLIKDKLKSEEKKKSTSQNREENQKE